MSSIKKINLEGHLIVTEVTYNLTPDYSRPNTEPNRRVLHTIGAIIKDEVGANCQLPNGRNISITETGAIINNSIPIELSPKRRTGGRLILEHIAINIRPATNDMIDQLLAQGYPLSGPADFSFSNRNQI